MPLHNRKRRTDEEWLDTLYRFETLRRNGKSFSAACMEVGAWVPSLQMAARRLGFSGDIFSPKSYTPRRSQAALPTLLELLNAAAQNGVPINGLTVARFNKLLNNLTRATQGDA